MLEVGTGVGYLVKALEIVCRFAGLGRPGDEERGSKGGSNEGAGLLRLGEAAGSEGSRRLLSLSLIHI